MTKVIAVAGYGELSDVYEWLIGDDKLTPAKAAAFYCSDLVGSLPPNARLLDCACGTGQLAVGLAILGYDVVATDASDGMVRRTEMLASEQGASLRAFRAHDPSSRASRGCSPNARRVVRRRPRGRSQR